MHTSSGTGVAAGALRFGGGIGIGIGDGHGACATAGQGTNAANSPSMAAVHAHFGANREAIEWRAQAEVSCMAPLPRVHFMPNSRLRFQLYINPWQKTSIRRVNVTLQFTYTARNIVSSSILDVSTLAAPRGPASRGKLPST